MPDTTLNITVQVLNQKRLEDLFAKIQDGSSTISEQKEFVRLGTKAWQELTQAQRENNIALGQAVASAKNLKDEGMAPLLSVVAQERDAYFQNGQALRSQEVSQRGLTEGIKDARKERRLYMFAVRESMEAITAVAGKESGLTKTMVDGASSVFGMKFALDMMGGTIAKIALPIALAIGVWTVIKELWDKSAESSKALREELEKQSKAIEGIIDNLVKLGKITKEEQINNYRAQIESLKSANAQTETVRSIQIIGGVPTIITADQYKLSLTERTENLKKISDLEVKIAGIQKEQTTETEKQSKERDKERTDLEKRYDLEYQLYIGQEQSYLLELKQREARAIKEGDLQSQIALQKQIMDLEVKIAQERQPSETNIGNVIRGQRPNARGQATLGDVPTGADPKTLTKDLMTTEHLYGSLAIATEKWNDEFNTTNILIGGFDSMLGNVSSKWTSTISDLISGTQNIGQAFSSMAKAIVESLEEIIARMAAMQIISGVLSIFGLSGGGEVSYAASGGSWDYRSTKNVVVGEKGYELMQVGKQGVRIIPHEQTKHMLGDISFAASGGNWGKLNPSGNFNYRDSSMTNAINNLARRIQPASPYEVNLLMIKQASVRNNGMTL